MGVDETTDYFGPRTSQAIRHLQRTASPWMAQQDRKRRHCCSPDQAKEYTMALGADGADVWNLQERLQELGYSVDVTGYFERIRKKSGKIFQRMSGLTEDGSVGHMTEELIYSSSAEKSFGI